MFWRWLTWPSLVSLCVCVCSSYVRNTKVSLSYEPRMRARCRRGVVVSSGMRIVGRERGRLTAQHTKKKENWDRNSSLAAAILDSGQPRWRRPFTRPAPRCVPPLCQNFFFFFCVGYGTGPTWSRYRTRPTWHTHMNWTHTHTTTNCPAHTKQKTIFVHKIGQDFGVITIWCYANCYAHSL